MRGVFPLVFVLLVLGLAVSILATDEVDVEANAMAKAIEQESKRVEAESKSMVDAIAAKGRTVDSKEEEEKFEKASQRTDDVMDSGEKAVEEKANQAEQLQNKAETRMDVLEKKVEEIDNQTTSDKRSADKQSSQVIMGSGKMLVPDLAGHADSRVTISYKADMTHDSTPGEMIKDSEERDEREYSIVLEQKGDDGKEEFKRSIPGFNGNKHWLRGSHGNKNWYRGFHGNKNWSRDSHNNKHWSRGFQGNKYWPRFTISYQVNLPKEKSVGELIKGSESNPLRDPPWRHKESGENNGNVDYVFNDDGYPSNAFHFPVDEPQRDEKPLFQHNSNNGAVDVSDKPFDDDKDIDEDVISEEKETLQKPSNAKRPKSGNSGKETLQRDDKNGNGTFVKIQRMLNKLFGHTGTTTGGKPVTLDHQKNESTPETEDANSLMEMQHDQPPAHHATNQGSNKDTAKTDNTVGIQLVLEPKKGATSSFNNDLHSTDVKNIEHQQSSFNDYLHSTDVKNIKHQQSSFNDDLHSTDVKNSKHQPSTGSDNHETVIKLMLDPLGKASSKEAPLKVLNDQSEHQSAGQNNHTLKLQLMLNPMMSPMQHDAPLKLLNDQSDQQSSRQNNHTLKLQLMLKSGENTNPNQESRIKMSDHTASQQSQQAQTNPIDSDKVMLLMLNPKGGDLQDEEVTPMNDEISAEEPGTHGSPSMNETTSRKQPDMHDSDSMSMNDLIDPTEQPDTQDTPSPEPKPDHWQKTTASYEYHSPPRTTIVPSITSAFKQPTGLDERPKQYTDYGLGKVFIPPSQIGKPGLGVQNQLEEDTILKKLAKQTPQEKAFQELSAHRISEEVNRRLQQLQPSDLPDPKMKDWQSLLHNNMGSLSGSEQMTLLTPGQVELMQTEYPDYAQREAMAEKSPQPISVMGVKKTRVQEKRGKNDRIKRTTLLGKIIFRL